MKKVLSILLLAVLLMTMMCMTSCSREDRLEKQLVNSWYMEGRDVSKFDLYSDGTCHVGGVYGTGTWAVINGDSVRIMDIYGRSQVMKVLDIDKDSVTFDTGDSEWVLYSSPQ